MSTLLRFSYFFAAIISIVFAATTAGFGQVNDDLVNAVIISSLPFADTLSNAGATLETNEEIPSSGCTSSDGGNSIWWVYTPTLSLDYVVETTDSDFDTILSIYTGNSHPLVPVVCNDDDGSGGSQSKIVTPLTGNVKYYIRVTGWGGNSGSVVLRVRPDGNDLLLGAVQIPDFVFVDTTSNIDAGVDTNESTNGCALPEAGNSVWWSFIPTLTDTLIADTRGSSFDTILDVYTGTGHPLVPVGCNDDSFGISSRVKFLATTGVQYYFRVVGGGTSDGDVVFRLTRQGDLFWESIPIGSLAFADSTTNLGTGVEPNESKTGCALPSNDGGNSVWWSFTPTFSDTLIAETRGSSFDTILDVYTGFGHPLVPVDCNNDSPGGGTRSRVKFAATSGVEYHFRVVGHGFAKGDIIFNLTRQGDFLWESIPISGVGFADTTSNVGAGEDAGEAVTNCTTGPNQGRNSMWWSFTPGFSDTLIVDTEGSSFDTILGVFTGTFHPLTQVACNDDYPGLGALSRVKFPATSGVTYYFRVEGWSGFEGDLVFRLTRQGDLLREPIPIAGIPFADTTSNVGAGIELLEPKAACAFADADGPRSVWWQWTAPVTVDVTVDTDDSGFDTVLSLRDDSATPAEIDCDDDSGNPGLQSKLHFTASAGSTYFFRVTGLFTAEGTAILNVRESVAFTGKVLLEGAYAGTGTMNRDANFANSMPESQPYAAASYNASFLDYDGPEGVVTSGIPGNAVDWILASLRTGTAAATEVPGSAQALFVYEDGSIVGTDGATVHFFAAPGSYHLVLRHRNHLGIMSLTPVDFSSGSGSWDFTTAGMAFTTGGAPMKDLGGGFFGMFAADASIDGQTTAADFNLWLVDTKAVATGYLLSDFNLDGQVTASDFNLWLTNTKAVASSKVP